MREFFKRDSHELWAVFFFQAEDGIRDGRVTGVKTCALPICAAGRDGATGATRRGAAGGAAMPEAAGAAAGTTGRGAPGVGAAAGRSGAGAASTGPAAGV